MKKSMFVNTIMAEVPEVLTMEMVVTTSVPLSRLVMRRLERAIVTIIEKMADDVERETLVPASDQVDFILRRALQPYPPVDKPS